MDWYEQNIEEPIRPLVKLLRENGYNTECSCGHEMYVQCQYVLDGSVVELHNLLYNTGYRNYEINIIIKIIDGHQHSTMDVRLPKIGNTSVLISQEQLQSETNRLEELIIANGYKPSAYWAERGELRAMRDVHFVVE